MKLFVYEISQVRNMQYDIDKLIQVTKNNFFFNLPNPESRKGRYYPRDSRFYKRKQNR